MYGSSLKVFSPSILSEENMPLIILKAGQYNEEIKKQILTKINAQATFYEIQEFLPIESSYLPMKLQKISSISAFLLFLSTPMNLWILNY